MFLKQLHRANKIQAGFRMRVTYWSTVQALVVQQVLLQDRLLTGQLLLSHLLQRQTQLIVIVI